MSYGRTGEIHESGPAYCKTCNVVTPIHEVCIEGHCWDHPAAWTHPFTPCCNGEDFIDMTEQEEAVAVVEMLADRLREKRAAA